MAVTYDRLWELLQKNDLKKKDLMNLAHIGPVSYTH